MKFKPKRWTEHHHLRIFHASFLATFLMICAVILFGLFFILSNSFVNAEPPASLQGSVTTTATVPEFSPGTTTPISGGGGGGGSYFVPVSTTTGTSLAYQYPPATISMQADPSMSTAQKVAPNSNTAERIVYLFKNDKPRFLGSTNVEQGFIFLEIQGPMAFSSSAQADINGVWQWQSPEALPAGIYKITAIVQDPNHPERTATTALEFALGKLTAYPVVNPPPTGNLANVMHLLVKVPWQFKSIRPGQEVGVVVKVLTQSKIAKNLVFEYTISNKQGNVGVYSDVVRVDPGGAEFLKTFYTNILADSGNYDITVRIHTAGQLLSAGDSFEIQGRGIIPTSGIMFVDFTVIFQILLVLFLLFGLISYFEYNKFVVMSRIIKQVTEEDLKKEEAGIEKKAVTITNLPAGEITEMLPPENDKTYGEDQNKKI